MYNKEMGVEANTEKTKYVCVHVPLPEYRQDQHER